MTNASDVLVLAAHVSFLLVCARSIQRWVEEERRARRSDRRRLPRLGAVLSAVCLDVTLAYYLYKFRNFYFSA